jgi:hypothetical protein
MWNTGSWTRAYWLAVASMSIQTRFGSAARRFRSSTHSGVFFLSPEPWRR